MARHIEERFKDVEIIEWIALLPTKHLSDLVKPLLVGLREVRDYLDGIEKWVKNRKIMELVDLRTLIPWCELKNTPDNEPDARFIHRIVITLVQVNELFADSIPARRLMDKWLQDPFAMQLVRDKKAEYSSGGFHFGVSLGSASKTEVEVSWYSPDLSPYYTLENIENLELIQSLIPWIGRRSFNGVPVLYTMFGFEPNSWIAFCPVCATFHLHKGRFGLQEALCNPRYWDVYELAEPTLSVLEILDHKHTCKEQRWGL